MRYAILIIIFLLSQKSTAQELHHRNKDLPCVNEEFKIAVHLVMDSLRQTASLDKIMEEIETVNRYFSPVCMYFSLCEIDTVYNYNYNILLDDSDLIDLAAYYSKSNRINLYVLHEEGFLGEKGLYSTSYGSIFEADTANIYVLKLPFLAHELGHYFGLYDTFEKQTGKELASGANCNIAGDLICDTPADPYNIGDKLTDYIKDCIFISLLTDANGQLYQPDVGNIMSYYYPCWCGFTYQQYKMMVKNYSDSK